MQTAAALPPGTGRWNRRRVLGGLVGVLAAGTGYEYARSRGLLVRAGGRNALAPMVVRARTLAGELMLIDVRRPDEWIETGMADLAIGLDMRRADFVDVMARNCGGDLAQPVAMICARGVRSAAVTAMLSDAGFSRVFDVPEGMLGSAAGPGWIARGLPIRQVAG